MLKHYVDILEDIFQNYNAGSANKCLQVSLHWHDKTEEPSNKLPNLKCNFSADL